MKNSLKRLRFVFLCLMAHAYAQIISIEASWAQSKIYTIEHKQEKLSFKVILPDNFQKNKTYPVLLAPGDPDRNEPSIYMGSNPSQFGWIIVESIINIKPSFANTLIEHIKAHYSTSMIFISGFSANSVPMFKCVRKNPKLFDGVIGMPGYANGIDQQTFQSNPNLKIILIVGARDTYWKKQAESAFKQLKNTGFDSSIHVIPNQGHKMEAFAGKPFFNLLNKRLGL